MPFLAERKLDVPEIDILSWYFDHPQFDLDQPIYIDASNPDRFYTGTQCKTLLRKLVAGFKAYGLKPDDTVAVHAFSDIDYSIAANGIVGFGGIFAGTNPSYTVHELVHHMKLCKTKILLVEEELLETALKAAKQAGIPRERVLIFDHHAKPGDPKEIRGLKSWRTLFDHGESDWVRLKGEKARKKTAAYLSTSGTTGLPKAAILTHHNFISQFVAVFEDVPRKWEIRRLLATPMFHVATAPTALFTPLRNGMKCFLLRRFQVDSFLSAIETCKINEAPIVPPMANAIINSKNAKKYDLSSIRYATSGAAPLGKEQQRRLKALLREDSSFTQVWGMTETTCIASMFQAGEHDTTGSVGRMVANMDAKLVDDAGADISAFDTRGELCVRGPSVIQGYFENAEANAAWDRDGYFHTGDIAVRTRDDRGGLWFIVDRKKELIKVRGFQVAPPELEAVLHEHPAVADAAVIGIDVRDAHGNTTELPRAYVTARDGERAAPSDIAAFVAERVAKYKRLDGGVVFVNEIPKNPSGKILKKVLREWAKRETGAKL